MARLVRHPSVALRASLVVLALVLSSTISSGRMRLDPPGSAYGAVGARAERGYFSQAPFERVDAVTGALALSFPVLVLPGNAGMDLRLTYTYKIQPHAMWTFSFANAPTGIRDAVAPQEGEWTPSLIMSDGSEQRLFTGVVDDYWVTTDFARYDATTGTLYLPNGWVATYAPPTEFSDVYRLTGIEDAYGNTITPSWGASGLESVVQTVDDAGATRTREVEFDYDGPITTMTYDERTWTFTNGSPSGHPAGALLSIEPPTGPDWVFSYGTDTMTVTTPNGGTVQYDFVDLEGRAVVDEVTTGGRAITSGTWAFDYDPGNPTTTTVTTPSEREITYVHDWDEGPDGKLWTLTSRTLTANSTEVFRLERTYANIAFGSLGNLKVVDTQDIEQDGVTFTTDFDYSSSDFGDYLQPHTITESASNHATDRVTTRTFDDDFSAYILRKVASQTVTIGSESFTTTFAYENATGFLTSQTAFGMTTTFARDDFGNLASVTDPLNHTSATEYQWGVPKNGATPEYAIYRNVNEDGTRHSEWQGWAGPVTYYTYDAAGRVTSVTPPAGAAVVTSYASDGSAVTVTRGSAWTTTTVDGFGRPIATENAEAIKTTTSYDAEGRRTFQSVPFTGSSGEGTDFEYDALGRVKKVIHPDDAYVLYTYSGTSVTITDELNRATTQTWQAFGSPSGGRLTSVVDAHDKTWAYSYNAAGSLTLVDPPGSVPNRTWTYNSANQLTSETHPESGTTAYTYNGDGLLATKTDARDVTTTYSYDDNHRLIGIDGPETADDVTFTYDARDNRTTMTAAGASSTFTYDAGSRLQARVDTIAGTEYTTAYEYDTRDNLTKVTYPSGRVVQYDYDSANRITKVYGGGTTFADDLAYHPTGALIEAEYGNGTSEALTLTNRFRPARLTSGPLDVTYSYDAVGNVTAIDDDRTGKDASFGYDDLDRLTSVTGFGATTFRYDDLGNRLTKGSGGTGVSYCYSSTCEGSTTHRLTSATSALGYPEAATFTYDDAGNMTGDGEATFTYSSRHMMTSAVVDSTTTTYGYDADGLRVAKTTAGSTTVTVRGLGGQPLAEYALATGVPALVREYIYLGGRLLASFAPEAAPTAVARVTGVAVSSPHIVAGTQVTVTVAGEAEPCPSVQINFGDGTTTSYPLSSPYALPLVVTHTYTTPGLRTIVATGETTGNGPCVGTVSTPVAVRSVEAMTNGDFSQGLDGGGQPVGWAIVSGGTALEWSIATGLEFYRPSGSTTGVAEQTTSLALPAGAPLEATFTLGNSDTVSKRVSVIVRSSGWDDLAICNFHLPASQSPTGYTMRMHTTVAWTAAAIAFYAADVNSSGTGSYQLDDVSLIYQPANSSAKTDCVDANAPTSGGSSGGSLITNGDFSDGTTGWTLSGSMTSGVVSEVLEYYRTTGSTTPVVAQATSTSVAAEQRLAAIFEMGNSSSTRQRVTVSLQESDATSFVSCVFWLAPGTARRAYAMTTFAPVAWTAATWAVVPSHGGAEGSHGWLELDTVSFAKTTDAVLGTECFEPGSFTISEEAPAPVPVPVPDALMAATAAPPLLRTLGTTTARGVGPAHGVRSSAPTRAVGLAHGARPRAETSAAEDAAMPDGSAPAATMPREAVAVLVHLAGSGAGAVTSSPTGVSCAGPEVSCHGWFAEGTTVTLTATPASGHAFAGWSGACSGTGTCDLFIDGELTATATFTGPPTLTYYHTDMLGSVRAITDANGDPVTRHDYFAFGESASALEGDPRRFLGQELDAETALDHFGARQYRNVWGRFTAIDPIFSAGARTNPQLWNRYAYGLNGPLRYSDPSGLEPQDGRPIEAAYGGANCTWSCQDFDAWVADYMLYQDTHDEFGNELVTQDQETPQGPSPVTAGGVIWLLQIVQRLAPTLQRLFPWAIRLPVPAATRISETLRPAGALVGRPGTSSQIRLLEGGLAEAQALFQQLSAGGRNIAAASYNGRLVSFNDGSIIGLRPESSSGHPTIDVFVRGLGIREIKFGRW